MSIKEFKKRLIKIIEDSDQFVTWDNTDKCFEDMEDDELTVCGENEKEIFAFKIIKV